MKHLTKSSTAKFQSVVNPIFDDILNPRLRVLLMIILGCDVYIHGMKCPKGMNAIKIIESSKAESSEEELFSSLQQQLMEANKLSKQSVDTYINAIMYEPTNNVYNNDSTSGNVASQTYLFQPSTSLPKYLEQYSIDAMFKDKPIFDGPCMMSCRGVGDCNHVFLSHEGYDVCKLCNNHLCMYCRGSIDANTYCLSCLAMEAIVPQIGSKSSTSIAEMREELVIFMALIVLTS
jgi:hypothetical protein